MYRMIRMKAYWSGNKGHIESNVPYRRLVCTGRAPPGGLASSGNSEVFLELTVGSQVR